MTGKKKKVDFSVRPRTATETLPPDADQWVRGGQSVNASLPKPRPETGPQKRLTLNLPAEMHTAFKGRCVIEGVTIQDKVRTLIEHELSAGAATKPV